MNRKTETHGLTLLEVLVALSILSIALLGVMKAAMLAQDALLESKTRCLAASLADNQLARIKQAGLENILAFSGECEKHSEYSWRIQEVRAAESLRLLRLDIYKQGVSKRVFRLEELFQQPTGR